MSVEIFIFLNILWVCSDAIAPVLTLANTRPHLADFFWLGCYYHYLLGLLENASANAPILAYAIRPIVSSRAARICLALFVACPSFTIIGYPYQKYIRQFTDIGLRYLAQESCNRQ